MDKKKEYKMKKYIKKYLPLSAKIKSCIAIFFLKNKKWELYKKNFTKVKVYREPKLIMTLLVKNEGDILEQNLKFHKKMGVDGFIVTDNVSSDETIQIIKKYIKKGWILEFIEEKNQNYEQAEWVDRMDKLAINKYHADWIINGDADEFFYTAKNNLKECLNPFYSLIKVRNCAMLSLNDTAWEENNYRTVINIPLCMKHLLIYQNKLSLFSSIVVSRKAIILASAYKKVYVGNHDCETSDFNDCSMTSPDILIYHYSYRGLEQFKKKIIEAAKSIGSNPNYHNKDVGSHVRFFYYLYNKGLLNLDDEYIKVNGSLILDDLIKEKIIIKDNTMRDILSKL